MINGADISTQTHDNSSVIIQLEQAQAQNMDPQVNDFSAG